MAQTIKLKRSAVQGNTPSTTDLALGEVAINTYDGKMFIKKDDGSETVVEVGTNPSSITTAAGTFTTTTTDAAILDAIATTHADTAVDVFVYDTSRDSDGGAWRHRTQHTSWYNETLNTATRGSRREFPAVAVIVLTSGGATIYDGDDPSLPMWMTFNDRYGDLLNQNGNQNAVFALNGFVFFVGSGLQYANFISDSGGAYQTAGQADYLGNLSERSSLKGFSSFSGAGIVDNSVNDVAMTVLPDAPIDPATGLPVPTIAVATDDGVSVIKDDGTVVDSAYNEDAGYVDFSGSGLWYQRDDIGATFFATFGDIDAGDGFGDQILAATVGAADVDLLAGGKGIVVDGATLNTGGGSAQAGRVPGLMMHQLNAADFTKGMSALLTSTYNTGYMNGDIKGAFLSDTDDTDLVGSETVQVSESFDSGTGIFSAKDAGTILENVSGALKVSNNDTSRAGAIYNYSITPGAYYRFSFDVVDAGSGWRAEVQNRGLTLSGSGTGSFEFYFTETDGTSKIEIGPGPSVIGDYATFDNVKLTRINARDADRSVNNNGLIVNGTVTRTAVATGADLVAYSGFSASNYLEQPYNSDFNFGTGDFCVMGWANAPVGGTGTTRYIFERDDGTVGTAIQLALQTSTNQILYRVGTVAASTTLTIPASSWAFVALVRRSGQLYFYANGVEEVEGASTSNLTSATATSTIGRRVSITTGYFNGSLALLRISATAPTADQIAKIYEDEKVLFQDGAQATLYGSSDAVTALAHDEVTDLLHVGTSAGRSVFQGLRRVDNTTDAVGVAISAYDELVVED